MYKVAATSGGLGDIVYSIPILRELNVKTIYIKENWYYHPNHSLYSAIKTFMESQGFTPLPTKGGLKEMVYEKGLKFDYDLDTFRKMPGRAKVHIQTNLRRVFNLPEKQFEPWITGFTHYKKIGSLYSVIHLTNRWREGSKVDWKKVLHSIPNKVYFLGFQHEWVEFCHQYGNIEWLPTDDIFDMAHIIASAKDVYCNQSVALTLSQGLGKEYFLDRKPRKTNTLMGTKNEHLL